MQIKPSPDEKFNTAITSGVNSCDRERYGHKKIMPEKIVEIRKLGVVVLDEEGVLLDYKKLLLRLKTMRNHIGTDIIEIERIRQAIEGWGGRFINRIYTPAELGIYGQRSHSLAASFAGKEAVMKLLGTGDKGVAWREIEVLYHASGKPYVRLNGRAEKVAGRLGIKEIDISLSHCREYAVATALGSC